MWGDCWYPYGTPYGVRLGFRVLGYVVRCVVRGCWVTPLRLLCSLVHPSFAPCLGFLCTLLWVFFHASLPRPLAVPCPLPCALSVRCGFGGLAVALLVVGMTHGYTWSRGSTRIQDPCWDLFRVDSLNPLPGFGRRPPSLRHFTREAQPPSHAFPAVRPGREPPRRKGGSWPGASGTLVGTFDQVGQVLPRRPTSTGA